MGHHWYGDGFNVVGYDVVSVLEHGVCFGTFHHVNAGARRYSEGGVGVATGGSRDFDDVLLDEFVDVDGFCVLLQGGDGVCGAAGCQEVDGISGLSSIHDCDFLARVWVSERDSHEEAVKLGFGQREGAFVFDGVLGCDDHEGAWQGMCDTFDSNLLLSHRFEECGLGLGCGAVNFVGEDDLRHYGAGSIFELTDLLVVDRGTGDVAGQEVRRKLHALEVATGCDGEGACEHGLADTGNVFDKDMSAAQEGDDGEAYRGVFTDDDPADVIDDAFNGVGVVPIDGCFGDGGRGCCQALGSFLYRGCDDGFI